MDNDNRGKFRKWLGFPSVSGIFAGLIPGVVALFSEVSQPFWVMFKIIFLTVAFGLAAANLIGLAVIKYRSSSGQDKSRP